MGLNLLANPSQHFCLNPKFVEHFWATNNFDISPSRLAKIVAAPAISAAQGSWQRRINLNVLKRTRIGEKFTVDFRAQFLNAFNMTDFFLVALADANAQGIGAQFGQTRTAFRDISVSGTNDPGGRLIEFQLRINF